jgi:hypothetical protein
LIVKPFAFLPLRVSFLAMLVATIQLSAQVPAQSVPSEPVTGSFLDYSILTVGPQALLGDAFIGSLKMLEAPGGYPHQWRLGAGAFGRNFGDVLARRGAFETGRFGTAALLHEDFRYQPSTSRNAFARGFHALRYTFVDKSDSGHNQIALANFVGSGAEGFVGELYLPPGYNTLSHAESRTGVGFAALAAQNLLLEFAPELAKLSRKLHIPATSFPVPEWWVPLRNR